MTSVSEASTPRPSEVDTVTDLLDQFYSNAWDEEEQIEEQEEDVSLYGLYDQCSPLSCPKSPTFKHDVTPETPVDKDLLAEKLWNLVKSAEHTCTTDPKHDQHGPDCTAKIEANTSIGASTGEPRGSPAPITHQESHRNLHKN